MKKTFITLLALAGVAVAVDTVEIDFGRSDSTTDGIYNIHTADAFVKNSSAANYVNGATSNTSTHSLVLGDKDITLTFEHYTGENNANGKGLVPTLTTAEESQNGGTWKGGYGGTLPGNISANVSDGLTSQNAAGTGYFTLTFSGLEAGIYSITGFGGYTGGDRLAPVAISLGNGQTADWSSMSSGNEGWTSNSAQLASNSVSFNGDNRGNGGASNYNKGYYFDAQNIQVGESGTITLTIEGTGDNNWGRTPLNYISLSKNVPEPTTATLSLLALRRRRK